MMNRCIPSREIILRTCDRPWYDSKVRNFSSKHDRLKIKASKSGKSSDWIKYKQLRNQVKNLIKEAKQRYFSRVEESVATSRSENPKTV